MPTTATRRDRSFVVGIEGGNVLARSLGYSLPFRRFFNHAQVQDELFGPLCQTQGRCGGVAGSLTPRRRATCTLVGRLTTWLEFQFVARDTREHAS